MTIVEKPYSQACENNKQPIIAELAHIFANSRYVLEIGSGTGQHAVYFAPRLSHLKWYTSDLPVNHGGIKAWLAELPAENLYPPLPFTIGLDNWPQLAIDGVFSANATHIMQPKDAKLMMQMIAEHLPAEGVFCQYGPFKIEGQYTSDSNQEFDRYLSQQGYGGIQDIADLEVWARPLKLIDTIAMPANNFILVWQKP